VIGRYRDDVIDDEITGAAVTLIVGRDRAGFSLTRGPIAVGVVIVGKCPPATPRVLFAIVALSVCPHN